MQNRTRSGGNRSRSGSNRKRNVSKPRNIPDNVMYVSKVPKFVFPYKPEDFMPRGIEEYVSDMVAKYYGDKNREREYNKAIKRIKAHLDPNTNEIGFYADKEEDLRFTQLQQLEEKLKKMEKYKNGDTSVYASVAEMEADKLYIETNNSAYNHYQTTKNNLKTLGKYGEKVNYLAVRNEGMLKATGHALVNIPLFIRNVGAVIYRGIGKPVSWIYGKLSKEKSGIYNNKPAHRYEARKDYFIEKENERLASAGKSLRPIRTLFKARWNAFFKYKEGNAAVLEAGYKDIKESYVNEAKALYYGKKVDELNKYIVDINKRIKNVYSKHMTKEERAEYTALEQSLQYAKNMKKQIMSNPKLQNVIKNGRFDTSSNVIVQTDAVSINQHDRANKASITRTVTGIKMLGGVALKFTGPKLKDWLIDNSKIKVTEKLPDHTETVLVEGREGLRRVDDVRVVTTKITSQQDLADSFSIKNLMKLGDKDTVSYGYGGYGNVAERNGLEFFRGAAQKIDGKLVSISDGNGYDITNITAEAIPSDLLNNGVISEDANLFDIVAVLQRQAGKNVTAKDLMNDVINCSNKEEQVEMIKNMTEGLDFWKSSSNTGIASGWNASQDEILRALEQVKTTTITEPSGYHFEKYIIPEHYESNIVKGGIRTVLKDNPRIIKALDIKEQISKGKSIVDAISMVFENFRDTKSKAKENKKQPRQYGKEVGFKGKSKAEDEKINKRKLNEEIMQEIEDMEK